MRTAWSVTSSDLSSELADASSSGMVPVAPSLPSSTSGALFATPASPPSTALFSCGRTRSAMTSGSEERTRRRAHGCACFACVACSRGTFMQTRGCGGETVEDSSSQGRTTGPSGHGHRVAPSKAARAGHAECGLEQQTSRCTSFHPMSGSWTNASSMAMSESRFSLRTFITWQHVLRKVPSMPLTSMARTSMRVSRKGTFSGYLRNTCACGAKVERR